MVGFRGTPKGWNKRLAVPWHQNVLLALWWMSCRDVPWSRTVMRMVERLEKWFA